jgi:hypothetical protein
MKKTKLLPTTILALLLVSCSDKEEAGKKTSDSDSLLSHLVLDTAPSKPLEIAKIRSSAKPGETVTFQGRVMGSDPVFMEGRAVMIMGDPKKMTPCNEIEDDECETPWDVCCDDPEVVTNSIVTVQAVDESGKPLKGSLKGLSGLKELDSVTVTGVVAKSSNKKNMVINATGLFVHQSKK